MNEQLQTELTKIITNINSGTDLATGFLSEQTPDVIKHLLTWNMIVSFLCFLGFFCLLVFIFKINKIQYNWGKAKMADDKYFDPSLFILNFLQLLWAIPLIELFNLDWLKIWLAPKIYLLEYISELIKN